MGKDRNRDTEQSSTKISIADRLGVDKNEIFNSLIQFYKKIAKEGCIIDAVDMILDIVENTTVKYFFIIGLIEFTKKYYGESDDFAFKW